MNTGATAIRLKHLTQSDASAGAGGACPCDCVVEARQRLSAAVQHSPDNGDLSFALGHLEMSLGNFEAALAAYSSAALLLPNAAAAHASRAVACQKLGRSHEAAQAALRAISLDPSDATALKVLARIHLDAGQHEAAEQACGQVLRRDAQDEEAAEMMREAQAQAAKLAENLYDSKVCPAV